MTSQKDLFLAAALQGVIAAGEKSPETAAELAIRMTKALLSALESEADETWNSRGD